MTRSDEWQSCYDDFCSLQELETYQDKYVKGLLKIIDREPSFLDAYAHIGAEYLEGGDLGEAEKYYRMGLDLALALILDGFKGTIPWGVLDNRPFLRLHHGLILCQIKKKNFKDAIKLMEQHLAWNPNDNIGVRFLLNEACVQSGITHLKYNDLGQNL